MDPAAHTLFGATLAETGLRNKTRYATATLIAGANIPDIDAVFTFLGRDMSLYLRRGHTHGVVALVVLPLILTGIMWALNKRKPAEDGPDFDLKWVMILAFISTWSHPLLDLMNTYGVRLLMPFDGRWFYGDALFIIDPYFWLMTAAGVVLARSNTKRAIAGWLMLTTLATLLVLLVPFVPSWVKVIWLVGVAAITLMRWKGMIQPRYSQNVSRFGVSLLVLYIAAVFVSARSAESEAMANVSQAELAVSNPMPGEPFAQRVVVKKPESYVVIQADGTQQEVPRRDPKFDDVIQRAHQDDSIKGFSNWMRLPHYTIIDEGDSWLVEIRDLRYVEPGEEARGIGLAKVQVPK